MKLLGEIICQLGVQYPQYLLDIQLYITSLGHTGEIEILSQHLEAVNCWVGESSLKLNGSKVELLFVLQDACEVPIARLDGEALIPLEAVPCLEVPSRLMAPV